MTTSSTDLHATSIASDSPNSRSWFDNRGVDDPAARRQAAIVALGRRAIASPPAHVLMEDAASLAADLLAADFFGIVEDVESERPLQFFMHTNGAKPNHPIATSEIARDAFDCLELQAMHSAQPIFIRDLTNESKFVDARLTRHQIKSVLIVPLVHVGKSFGTLGVYGKTAHAFHEEDLLFLESIAHLVTATLARVDYSERLTQQSEKWQASIDSMAGLHVLLTPSGRIVDCNLACLEVTDFRQQDLADRDIASAFLEPKDVLTMRDAITRANQAATPKFETDLLTKHGEQRRIEWILAPVGGKQGRCQHIIASGTDVSQRVELEERLLATQKELESLINPETKDIEGEAELPTVERRERSRRPYPYVQLIAPQIGAGMPQLTEFRETLCHDISAGGFSFLSNVIPDYTNVVVAFGTHPSLIYLEADIRHTTPITVEEQTMFMIGCHYKSRV